MQPRLPTMLISLPPMAACPLRIWFKPAPRNRALGTTAALGFCWGPCHGSRERRIMSCMTASNPAGGKPHGSRITVEVPVLRIGAGQTDYEGLNRYVDFLRKPQGLHMTLLHVGILDDLVQDIE